MGVAVHLVGGMNVGMTRDCDLAGSVRSWAAASSTTAKSDGREFGSRLENRKWSCPVRSSSCRHVAMTTMSATDLTQVRHTL
jgi:hypothetical protein